MATAKNNVCNHCGTRESVDQLFDALCDVQRGKLRCSCGRKSHLELEFGFGMGKYPHRCEVLDVFLPERRQKGWRERGRLVQFYTFLVIVRSIESDYISAWLSYWHVERNNHGEIARRKYGQWAPFIRDTQLASLIAQAKAKRYNVI